MSVSGMRFEKAIASIDRENARDPNRESVGGAMAPREVLYSERLTEWVKRLRPVPSEALLLAARGQHICRWQIPRERYEASRKGYLRWREDLKKLHAELVTRILGECGYEEDFIQKVEQLITKKNYPADPEACVLEDALTLCFLQFQLESFIEKYGDDKTVEVLGKAWKKLSQEGKRAALSIEFTTAGRALINKALAPCGEKH